MPTETSARSASDIEVELSSIDAAIQEQSLADVAAPETPKPKERNYEVEAHYKGWKPKAEYEGPEGSWVDAKTFIERGDRFVKNLEKELSTLKSQVAGFEGTKAQFRKFFDDQMAKRDKEHAEAISALRIQRTQAIREGDDELAVELEDRIDATKAQQSALKAEAVEAAADKTAVAHVEDSPVLLEWISDGNNWFKKDEILTQHAIAVGEAFRKQGDKSLGRVFLDKVGEQVRSDFPRRFKAATAPGTRQSTTESGGAAGTTSSASASFGGKTERDLPPADLAIMRQFIKEGLYTKEQFLRSYFSRNG